MGRSFCQTILDFSTNKTFKGAQSQLESFYKNGAISFPEKKIVKQTSIKEFNMNLGKVEKKGGSHINI